MPDLWKTILNAVVGAIIPLVVGAIFGIPAWVRSRWEARRRQDELVGKVDVLSGLVEYLRQELAESRAESGREISKVREAQHVQMRHELIHTAEKYLTRGWLTSAERESWWESFQAYQGLGKNGYIASYWTRIQALEIREV